MPMTEGHHSPDGCCNLEEFAPRAQAEQAEAERPDQPERYTADVFHPNRPYYMAQTTVVRASDFDAFAAQYERIVGALRAVIAQLRQHKNDYMDSGQETYRALQNEIREREAEIARLDGLVSGRTAERDAALARVAEHEAKLAEMERQEPSGWLAYYFGGKRNGKIYGGPCGTKEEIDRYIQHVERSDDSISLQGKPFYAAPVALAQQLHDMDKQCRDDVARALGLRPSQERGFAWSYLLASIKSCVKASEDAAQAQHGTGYAEARQCVNCRHIGINDAADYAACHDCNWTGPEPDEDKCSGCAGENCMAAACPECGGRYDLVAEANITAPAGQVPQAWLDVQAERRRQVEAEGWTPEHDDEHSHGQMARAAACYALAGSSAPNDGTAALLVSLAWPWDEQWWKPTSARRDLIKACALALAEIERLDRATAGGDA
ncbi:hypothetical protein L7Q72_18820 [Pseudomonas aeruginosa]|uniref:hypothetical protein n=1 Tax=Pseudomonas aeruginosa TaxID=287 RepID=UPI001EDA5C58|nr:hypothetical protein [Pseudomonas aeruginosa]MCG3079697.1 hypothetical protein [Pseudomonas aeruginosa]